jgi:hypothetical protein
MSVWDGIAQDMLIWVSSSRHASQGRYIGYANLVRYIRDMLEWDSALQDDCSFLELVILAWAAGPKQSLYHLPSLGIQVSRLTRNRASSWTCLTANQRLVAAGTAEDRLVIVWSADSGQVVAAMPGHASPLTSIHFSSVSSLNQSSPCRMFTSSVYSVIVVLFSQRSRGGGGGVETNE